MYWSERRSGRFTCGVFFATLLFILRTHSQASGAALTPGNILVSAQYVNSSIPNGVLEYTPSGQLVQSFNIPFPRGSDPSGSSPGGLAVTQDGKVQIYDGVFNAYLASLDPVSGTINYHQANNFGAVGQIGACSITSLGNYAYLVDMVSSTSSQSGIVRFNVNDFSSQLFLAGTGFGRLDNGLNGYLYAVPDSQHVDKIDPVTMSVLSTFSFSPYFVDQVVADKSGDLYMSGEGYIREFSPAGTLLKSLQLPFGAPYDMSLSPAGQIIISGWNQVGLTDLSLDPVVLIPVAGSGPTYATFVSSVPIPEPGAIVLTALVGGLSLIRRPHHRCRTSLAV